MPMIELDEDSKIEFEEEAGRIAQSLNRYIDKPDFERVASCFQNFLQRALASSSFDEQEYLEFAEDVVENLVNITDDKDVVILLVNLSRLDSGVARIYQEKNLNIVVSQAIADSPDYFITPFNRVMVFEYLYNYYYCRAQGVLTEEGVDTLLNFLTTELNGRSSNKEEILTSLLSSFMSIYFTKDKAALVKIINRFRNISPIENKALKLISRL